MHTLSRIVGDTECLTRPVWRKGSVLRSLAGFDRRICFHVFLTVAPEIGDDAGSKVYVIAHNPGTPGRFEKLRESAFPCLIGPQCRYERLTVESRYVSTAGYERYTLHHNRPIVGQEQALACR